MMTGNIAGMPVDNVSLRAGLTEKIRAKINGNPKEGGKTKLQMWFGAYRKGLVSWNHSKIIAVDGKRLIAGGHNMWDKHYCSYNPCRDFTAEYEGPVAIDGHVFPNFIWQYVNRKHLMAKTQWLPNLSRVPLFPAYKVELVRFPDDAAQASLPPMYSRATGGATMKSKAITKLHVAAKKTSEPVQGTVDTVAIGTETVRDTVLLGNSGTSGTETEQQIGTEEDGGAPPGDEEPPKEPDEALCRGENKNYLGNAELVWEEEDATSWGGYGNDELGGNVRPTNCGGMFQRGVGTT